MGSTQAPRKLHASFRGRGLKTRVRGSAGEPEKVSYFSPHSLFQRYVRAAEVNCSAGPSTEVETVAAEVARKCPRFRHSSILFSSLSYFVLSYPIVSYLIVSCPIVVSHPIHQSIDQAPRERCPSCRPSSLRGRLERHPTVVSDDVGCSGYVYR